MHASYLPICSEIWIWTKINWSPLIFNDIFRVSEINDSFERSAWCSSIHRDFRPKRFSLVQVYDKIIKGNFEGFRFGSTTGFPSGGGVYKVSLYISIRRLSLQVLITFRVIPNSSKKFCFSVVEFSSKKRKLLHSTITTQNWCEAGSHIVVYGS